MQNPAVAQPYKAMSLEQFLAATAAGAGGQHLALQTASAAAQLLKQQQQQLQLQQQQQQAALRLQQQQQQQQLLLQQQQMMLQQQQAAAALMAQQMQLKQQAEAAIQQVLRPIAPIFAHSNLTFLNTFDLTACSASGVATNASISSRDVPAPACPLSAPCIRAGNT